MKSDLRLKLLQLVLPEGLEGLPVGVVWGRGRVWGGAVGVRLGLLGGRLWVRSARHGIQSPSLGLRLGLGRRWSSATWMEGRVGIGERF